MQQIRAEYPSSASQTCDGRSRRPASPNCRSTLTTSGHFPESLESFSVNNGPRELRILASHADFYIQTACNKTLDVGMEP